MLISDHSCKLCENLSDDLPSLCFILLAHNLHVSELAFTRKYYYASITLIVRGTNIGWLWNYQNHVQHIYKIFSDQNRSPSPSPAPPQSASSPIPENFNFLVFARKALNIISSEQSAKLCQSFWTHGEVQVSMEAFLCISLSGIFWTSPVYLERLLFPFKYLGRLSCAYDLAKQATTWERWSQE